MTSIPNDRTRVRQKYKCNYRKTNTQGGRASAGTPPPPPSTLSPPPPPPLVCFSSNGSRCTDICGQLENSGHTLCCSHATDRYIFNVFQDNNSGFFQLRQLGRFGGDSEVQWETSEERTHRGGRAQQAQQGEDARRAREHLSVQLGVGGGGGGQEELGPAQPIHHKSQVRLDLTFLRPILGLFVNLRQKIKLIERTKI